MALPLAEVPPCSSRRRDSRGAASSSHTKHSCGAARGLVGDPGGARRGAIEVACCPPTHLLRLLRCICWLLLLLAMACMMDFGGLWRWELRAAMA